MRISDWSSDVCSSDLTVDPHWANAVLPMGFPVQGNLDPLALIAGGRALETAVENILSAFENRRSEEHTSELQSLMRISYAVFCLKKKKHKRYYKNKMQNSHTNTNTRSRHSK